MTQVEARKLKLGDKVKWVGELGYGESEADQRAHVGVVDDKGYAAIRVKWDDGINTLHYFAQPAQCAQIDKIK